MDPMMKSASKLLLLLALAMAVPLAVAQTGKWPEKPVRVVVPYPPGGTTDIVARIVATLLSGELGQQFIVENRAGAGGQVGAGAVAQSAPDGYTLLVMGSGFAANAALYKQLTYDPVKDFAPVATLTSSPLILAASPAVPATTLQQFVSLARAKPGTINFGSAGNGSFPHLSAELFRQLAKIEVVHVPYKGDGPAITGLLGGEVQFLFASGPAVMSHIKSGKMRALGVTTEQRSPALPDVPAISEVVPGYSVRTWFGMWAPAGTPKALVSRLNQTLGHVLGQPQVREQLNAQGMEPAHSSPEDFERNVVRDIATWSNVVKAGNIKVN
jgi:tripartite-type tricarboxylate transporter receptor subunit TctC